MLAIARRLDARGWLCPRPLVEARRMLRDMAPGEWLEVVVTDPHGPLDFEVLCARGGHRLHGVETLPGERPPAWRVVLTRSVDA
jgi:tRNA 2-thiouridine synthesizing protein A